MTTEQKQSTLGMAAVIICGFIGSCLVMVLMHAIAIYLIEVAVGLIILVLHLWPLWLPIAIVVGIVALWEKAQASSQSTAMAERMHRQSNQSRTHNDL